MSKREAHVGQELTAVNKNPSSQPVHTENSVQSENAELTTVRETIALPMSNSLFVALLALIAAGFRTRAALQAEILALRHQLARSPS